MYTNPAVSVTAKQLFYFVFCLLAIQEVKAQQDTLYLTLPDQMGSKQCPYEYSSMVIWKDRLLLIPSLKRNGYPSVPQVYSIPLREVDRAIAGDRKLKHYTRYAFDLPSFQKHSANKCFDGIEASVVANDTTLYFAIETTAEEPCGRNCYIVRASIGKNKTGDTILTLGKSISLAKPDSYMIKRDGGFESLAINRKGNLITVFEYLNNSGDAVQYLIDQELANADLLEFPRFRNTRFTDMVTMPDGSLVAINVSFNTHQSPDNYRYDLVSVHDGQMNYLHNISTGKKDLNWEGLAVYKNYFLLINDNTTGPAKDRSEILVIRTIPK